MNKTFNFLLAACASFALFACSSDEGTSGKGSNEACAANAECASGICAVVAGGDKCAPASNACTPACGDGQACVDIGNNMGLCIATVTESTGQGGAAGTDGGNEAGAGGAAGTDGGNEAGAGGAAGSDGGNEAGAGGMSGAGGSTDPDAPGCADLLGCFDTCADGDQPCITACFESNPEGGALYQAIIGCAQASGCVGLDQSFDQQCINEECPAEMEACFGPQATPMGTLDCNDYLGCVNACPEGDDGTCRFDCTESASPEGYATFEAVIACLQDNGCFGEDGSADSACLEPGGVCGMAWEACTGPAAVPMGTDTCEEFVSCFTACPQGDSDCVNGCVEASSQQGYDDYNAVIDCGRANMCFDDDGNGDGDCFEDNCAAESVPCFGEPLTPMGEGDCISLVTCLDACDDTDPDSRETCARPCVAASSQDGFDNLNAMNECITASTDANGQPCPDVACAQAACNAEAALCYADGMIPAPGQ